ncbi:MAG TPA: pitrilysin family protein [Bacteroidia bacterium]|nr:pitrilysin family protein [Bacteroidia bacterium]
MKKLLALSLCLALSWTMALAQKNLPSNFFMTKLENGLEILVIEDNSVPLATIEICVHNGSYTEDHEYNGLSHLYEHMFFKANKDLPSQEKFLARINELGITFNGTTSNERVNYFLTLSNAKVNDGLTFMNSAIRYPLFLQEEMKKENPVVDGEFQRAESNPVFWLLKDMDKKLWGDNFSRKNTIGDHDIILSATPEKMKVIQEKYYYPNNSMLTIAGDVNHDAIFAQVKALYADWKPSTFNIFEKYPIPEFAPLTESSTFLTENANAKTPIIMVGMHGPDTRNDIPATYAADVFSFILEQKSSKFQKDLIDAGLAFQAQVGYQTCKYVGPINIFLVPNPAKVQEAYKKLLEHMNMWDSDDYFTDDQLETAKNLLVISQTRERESTSSYVHNVTFWWASASIDYYTSYIDNLKKVTRQDIKNYVTKYIKNKPMATGLLVSPEMKTKMNITDASSFLK